MFLEKKLKNYKFIIEKAIKDSLSSFGKKNQLTEAIEYSLLTEGKRFRPAIVLMVADSLGSTSYPLDAALAIEFFHTASLIADDLPCMDDDELRRERPALHVAFTESIALLSTYALISAGYERIHRASKNHPECEEAICQLALESATKNTGIFGATGGQYLDLFLEKPTEESVMEIMEKKTGTFFEISFVFGWLFGGGKIDQLELVKKVANHFGLAFQIADDFQDLIQDQKRGSVINYPLIAGEKKGFEVLSKELDELFLGLDELSLEESPLMDLANHLKQCV